jgi:hypothetical protein
MTSRPSRANGIDCSWIGVGCVNLRLAQASHSSSRTPRSANVFFPTASAEASTAASSSCSSPDSESSSSSSSSSSLGSGAGAGAAAGALCGAGLEPRDACADGRPLRGAADPREDVGPSSLCLLNAGIVGRGGERWRRAEVYICLSIRKSLAKISRFWRSVGNF